MSFKMKGFTFPGITTKGNENMKDGRSKSSAFQKDDIVQKNKQKQINKNVSNLQEEWKNLKDRNSNKAKQLQKEAAKIGLTLDQDSPLTFDKDAVNKARKKRISKRMANPDVNMDTWGKNLKRLRKDKEKGRY